MKAILFPCPYTHLFCETFNCQGHTRWYVGRIDGPPTTSYRLCDDCARSVIANAPTELMEGSADLETRLRAELETDFAVKIRELESVLHTKQMEFNELHKRLLAMEEAVKAEPVAVEKPPEELPVVEAGIFRCLECDKEFDNKRALSNHMRTHLVAANG